ncbi:MAG: hypothetical protein JO111_12160 [Caulobacteraceae bacterium]|nr:hypothetical protein [Caulobacteraceae bacterium]
MDLQIVFAAIGRAMAGGRLHPQTLKNLPVAFGEVLPNHLVKITHKTKAELSQSAGLYVITITGDRWRDSQGGIRSGELERLSREAAQAPHEVRRPAP